MRHSVEVRLLGHRVGGKDGRWILSLEGKTKQCPSNSGRADLLEMLFHSLVTDRENMPLQYDGAFGNRP